ncbi:hypothetical protein [Streptomyces sp. NPDC053541]|uniref:hypothetical protein n=1 Tax=Streptomyces sp. NPDC053541 TaxID=3365709 RepID=UPI0037D7B363
MYVVFDLVRAVVLGIIAIGVVSLVLAGRSLQRQVDDLRAEVAVARIEGILGGAAAETEAPAEPRPPRRLAGVGAYLGALIGALVATYGSWLVWA